MTIITDRFGKTVKRRVEYEDIELVLDKYEAAQLLNILDQAAARAQREPGEWERWTGARELHDLVEDATRTHGWVIDDAGRQFGPRLIMHNPMRGAIPSRDALQCIEAIIKGTAAPEWPMKLPPSDDPETMVTAIRQFLEEHNRRLEEAARINEKRRAEREEQAEAERRREAVRADRLRREAAKKARRRELAEAKKRRKEEGAETS